MKEDTVVAGAGLAVLLVWVASVLASVGFSIFVVWAIIHFVCKYW